MTNPADLEAAARAAGWHVQIFSEEPSSVEKTVAAMFEATPAAKSWELLATLDRFRVVCCYACSSETGRWRFRVAAVLERNATIDDGLWRARFLIKNGKQPEVNWLDLARPKDCLWALDPQNHTKLAAYFRKHFTP